MKKTISGIMCGIIAIGMLTGCRTEVFSKFEYESRGAPWDVVYKLTIDFDKRILITLEADDRTSFSSNPKTKTISLNPEQVSELQKALNRAGVTDWNDEYDSTVVCGTSWNVSYVLPDGKNRKIHGHMNWPRGFEMMSTAIEKLVKANTAVCGKSLNGTKKQ